MSDTEKLKNEETKAQGFELPKGFEPFESVNFCGLRAIKVPLLVEAEGFAPLIVGKGRAPRVWLARLAEESGGPWKWAVSDNTPEDSSFRVTSDEEKRTVSVKRLGIPMFSAHVGPFNTLTVDFIDLRPIGISIHGEKNALYACEQRMSNCAYMNVNAVFDIGPPPKS